MHTRQASLLVADEIYFNLFGKAILQGIYHSDLGITNDPSPTNQLVFFFMADTDVNDAFDSLVAEVILPGSAPVRNNITIIPPTFVEAANQHKTRINYRHPLLVPGPILRPGEIKAKLIHEKGEIILNAPWIVMPSQSQ